jgi:hypothetical protein
VEEASGLKIETEALITAAQEATRASPEHQTALSQGFA